MYHRILLRAALSTTTTSEGHGCWSDLPEIFQVALIEEGQAFAGALVAKAIKLVGFGRHRAQSATGRKLEVLGTEALALAPRGKSAAVG